MGERAFRKACRLLKCTGMLLGLVGLGVVMSSGGCTSQREASLSALHYFQRGNAAYQAEDYRRAIDHYRKALDFDSDAPDIHYNLGLAYFRAQDWTFARDAFQRAVQLDGAFAEAHLNLALTYDKLYNAPLAHQHYNRYRELAVGAKAKEEAAATAANASPPPLQPGQSVPQGAQSMGSAQVPRGGGVQSVPSGNAAAQSEIRGTPQRQRRGVGRGYQAVPTQSGAGAGIGGQQPPNPFQGNEKWWTQDAQTPTQ